METKQWKVLTCALLEIVLLKGDFTNTERKLLLQAAEGVGMTLEEYQYLV